MKAEATHEEKAMRLLVLAMIITAVIRIWLFWLQTCLPNRHDFY